MRNRVERVGEARVFIHCLACRVFCHWGVSRRRLCSHRLCIRWCWLLRPIALVRSLVFCQRRTRATMVTWWYGTVREKSKTLRVSYELFCHNCTLMPLGTLPGPLRHRTTLPNHTMPSTRRWAYGGWSQGSKFWKRQGESRSLSQVKCLGTT
jgi:hypothetical protein